MSYNEQLTKTSKQKQQSTSSFDTYGLLACLSISVFLIAWITFAGKSLNFGAVIFLFALPWVLLRAGAIITAALRYPSFFALDFLLGASVVSIAVMTWKLFVPVSLWVLLIVLLVAIVSIPQLLPHHQRDPLSSLGLLAVFVSLVAATGWSQDLICPTKSVADGVMFKPWSDFFVHATIVARSVGYQSLLQVGNYEWKGFPLVAYHYASYSLASCLVEVSSLPAYTAVVGFWAPFGSFLAGLASYALGRAIWSQGAGLAALIAVVVVPDATLLNIGHPIYGYFWLQHIAPGGLYGVALAGTALILILQGGCTERRSWVAAGVLVGALVGLFKIHVLAAAFPLLVSFAILAWPARKRTRWLVFSICVAAGAALIALANQFHIGPNIHLGFSDSAWYWKLLANQASGTPVESWFRIFGTGDRFLTHLAQAIGLLLLNGLGIFAILGPLTWLLAVQRNTWQMPEQIAVTAVAILLLMTFSISGGPAATEFMHRPFVWAYWLVGSLTAGRLFSMAAGRRWQPSMCVAAIIILALMIVPIRYGSGLERGKSPRQNAFSNVHVDRGLIDCANYIRQHAPADAVVQDSQLDELLILGALSERPSFAARSRMWLLISEAFRESRYPYQERLRRLQSLQQATNLPELQRNVHETGIRWYVLHPGDSNVWPAEFRDRPAFESNGYKLYDMNRCFDLGQDPHAEKHLARPQLKFGVES